MIPVQLTWSDEILLSFRVNFQYISFARILPILGSKAESVLFAWISWNQWADKSKTGKKLAWESEKNIEGFFFFIRIFLTK